MPSTRRVLHDANTDDNSEVSTVGLDSVKGTTSIRPASRC